MTGLLVLVWQVATLRRPPQVLPASVSLTVLALLVHAASGALLAAQFLPAGRAVAYAAAETAFMAATIQAVLALAGHRARAGQTLSALGATGALINVAALPVMWGVNPAVPPPTWTTLAVLALFGWSFAVAAHVLRHALSVPPAAAAGVALGYFVLSYGVMGAIFPPP